MSRTTRTLPPQWTDDRAPRTGWNAPGYIVTLDLGPNYSPGSIHSRAGRKWCRTLADVVAYFTATVDDDRHGLIVTDDPDRPVTAYVYAETVLDPMTGDVIDPDPYPVRSYVVGPRGGIRREWT